MVKTALVLLSVLGISSFAFAENLECLSHDKEIKLEITDEDLVVGQEDAPDIQVGKANIYSITYRKINVSYGLVSTEFETYGKSFDHEASRHQVGGNTALFLAESDAKLLEFSTRVPSAKEKAEGVITKIVLKKGQIYNGYKLDAPTKKISIDLPASVLSCKAVQDGGGETGPEPFVVD